MKTIKEINIPEIDISEIDAKSKEIEENINYDEVRDRIRQVLDKITDKKNRGKKVSQDTIGKYLFPHLGADSSTQSTMSRFVNGNKKTKNPSDNCPDIKALTRLSQLTGISTDWFLYGENSSGINNKKKTLRDYARLMFIDMKNDLGATFTTVECPTDNLPFNINSSPTIRIDIPLRVSLINDTFDNGPVNCKLIGQETASSDLLKAVYQIIGIYASMENMHNNFHQSTYNALRSAITSIIQLVPARPVTDWGGVTYLDDYIAEIDMKK